MSGTALALHTVAPGVAIYSAEPEKFDDMARPLRAGRHKSNDPSARPICDAIMTPTPGDHFQPLQAVAGRWPRGERSPGTQEMAAAFHYLKIVVEPGGAVALASALSGKIDMKGKPLPSSVQVETVIRNVRESTRTFII